MKLKLTKRCLLLLLASGALSGCATWDWGRGGRSDGGAAWAAAVSNMGQGSGQASQSAVDFIRNRPVAPQQRNCQTYWYGNNAQTTCY